MIDEFLMLFEKGEWTLQGGIELAVILGVFLGFVIAVSVAAEVKDARAAAAED